MSSRLAQRGNARIDLIPALDGDDAFAILTENDEPIAAEDGTQLSLEQGS